MRYAMTLLIVLAACGPKAPPQPIAQTCPAAPRVVPFSEIMNVDCNDEKCVDQLQSEYGDAVIKVSDVLGVFRGGIIKKSAKSHQALDELVELKKNACACTDATCANEVEGDFETWMKANEDTKGSQDEAEKAGKLAGDIQECIAKALAGDGDD
jgi:hypothetical protein